MCLETVSDKKTKKLQIKNLKTDWRGYVIAWKVIEKNEDTGECYSPYYETKLHKDVNVFKENKIKCSLDNVSYKGGTHLFITKNDAKRWQLINQKILKCKVEIIKCKVKKKWINNIGTQILLFKGSALVIVCSKTIFFNFKKESESKFKKWISNFCKKG